MSAERPPFRTVAAYRLWRRRPDRRYDAWLRADLGTQWFAVRDSAWSATVAVVVAGVVVALRPAWLPVVATSLGFGIVLNVVGAARERAGRRAQYFPEDVPPDEIGHFQPYRGIDGAGTVADRDGAR